jgi:hypothetical protein
MKKTLYSFVYLLVVFLTIMSCKKSSDDQQPSPPATTQTTVTGDNYVLITVNMSYTQVVNILGKPTTTSGNNYTWSADNSNSIVITLVIVNGVVQSKSQTGLYIPTSGSTTGTSSGGCPSTYNGHTVYVGPKGGCYYINSNGNKTYI